VRDDEAILAVILGYLQEESPASYGGGIASALGEGLSR
jgi:hypothetical protein